MKYKSYVARIDYDEVDRIFVGHLAGINHACSMHLTYVSRLIYMLVNP